MRAIVLLAGSLLAAGCGSSSAQNAVVPFEQVPEPLVKKARETLPDVTFDTAWRLPNGDYEIRGKDKKGKIREVEMTPDGKVIDIE